MPGDPTNKIKSNLYIIFFSKKGYWEINYDNKKNQQEKEEKSWGA